MLVDKIHRTHKQPRKESEGQESEFPYPGCLLEFALIKRPIVFHNEWPHTCQKTRHEADRVIEDLLARLVAATGAYDDVIVGGCGQHDTLSSLGGWGALSVGAVGEAVVVVVDVVAFDWIEDVEFGEKLDEDWMDGGREGRGFPYERKIAMS